MTPSCELSCQQVPDEDTICHLANFLTKKAA